MTVLQWVEELGRLEHEAHKRRVNNKWKPNRSGRRLNQRLKAADHLSTMPVPLTNLKFIMARFNVAKG